MNQSVHEHQEVTSLSPSVTVVGDLPERAIGIDVGGTGMKGGIVDLVAGELIGDRFRVDTPQPATPQAVAEHIEIILAELESRPEAPDAATRAVGVDLPGVVIDDVVLTAANIDDAWIGCDARALLGNMPGNVSILNDADAAGLAEARYGAGKDLGGTILTMTLGTGIGSALVHDGILVPNSELGHLEFEGAVAETVVSAASRKRLGTSWKDYSKQLTRYLKHVERIQPVSMFIIGGGISSKAEKFLPNVKGLRAQIVPAHLTKNAGIVGAALFAAERGRIKRA